MGSPHAAHFGAKTLEEQREIEGKLWINTKREACMFSVITRKAAAVNNLPTGKLCFPRS